MKEVKISFYASIDEDDLVKVRRALNKYGAEVINENFEEFENVGYFSIEEDPINDNWEE